METPMSANNNILNTDDYATQCYSVNWKATPKQKKSYFKAAESKIMEKFKKIDTTEFTLDGVIGLYVRFFNLMFDYRKRNNISSRFLDFYKSKKSGNNNIKQVKEVLEHKFPDNSTLNEENKKMLFTPLEKYKKSYMFFRSYFNKKHERNGCSLIANELKNQGQGNEMSDNLYEKVRSVFSQNVKLRPIAIFPLVSGLDQQFIDGFYCLYLAGSQNTKDSAKSEYTEKFLPGIKNQVDKFGEVLKNLGELMKNENLEDLFKNVIK